MKEHSTINAAVGICLLALYIAAGCGLAGAVGHVLWNCVVGGWRCVP